MRLLLAAGALGLTAIAAAAQQVPDPLAGQIQINVNSPNPLVTGLCPGFIAMAQGATAPIVVPLAAFMEFPSCVAPAPGGTISSDSPAIVTAVVSGNEVMITPTKGAAGNTVLRYFVGGVEAGQINYFVRIPGSP